MIVVRVRTFDVTESNEFGQYHVAPLTRESNELRRGPLWRIGWIRLIQRRKLQSQRHNPDHPQDPSSRLVSCQHGRGLNLVSKSIVLPSWRNRIQRLNIPRLRASKKSPLEVARVMLLHVLIRDLEVPGWFDVVNELAVNILVETSFYRLLFAMQLFFLTWSDAAELETSSHQCDGTRNPRINELSRHKWHNDCDGITEQKQRTSCATDGDTTENLIIRTCNVHSDRLENYGVEALNARGEQAIPGRDVENFLPVVLFYGLVTSLSTKPVRLLKMPVISRGAKSPMLRQQPSGPLEPTNDEGEVSTLYKPKKAKNRGCGTKETSRSMMKNDLKTTRATKSR